MIVVVVVVEALLLPPPPPPPVVAMARGLCVSWGRKEGGKEEGKEMSVGIDTADSSLGC